MPLYYVIMTTALCVAYVVLAFLFAAFFRAPWPRFGWRSLVSLGIIIAVSVSSYLISFAIHDRQLSNRALHIVGGGLVSFLICFLVTKDHRLQIPRFQFFIFSMLIVTAMGVGNEIIECIVQYISPVIFAQDPRDTWYDLISNLVGSLAASVVLMPFTGRGSGTAS